MRILTETSAHSNRLDLLTLREGAPPSFPGSACPLLMRSFCRANQGEREREGESGAAAAAIQQQQDGRMDGQRKERGRLLSPWVERRGGGGWLLLLTEKKNEEENERVAWLASRDQQGRRRTPSSSSSSSQPSVRYRPYSGVV